MRNAPDPLRGTWSACYNGSGKGALYMTWRCWSFLLVLWPYAGVIMSDVLLRFDVASKAPWLVWLAGWLILCGLNIVCALLRKENHAQIGVTTKLLMIPYYVVSFFLGYILFVSAPPAVMLVLLMNSLLLLATSAYTLRSVYLGWRTGSLPATWAVVLAVSQLIFVLDVVGSIVLYILEKRRSH